MDVDVQEAGRHIEPAQVDHLPGIGGIDASGYRRNHAIFDRDVAHGARSVLGVNDMPALKEKVITGLPRQT